MKSSKTDYINLWINALSERQKRLLNSKNISSDEEYIKRRDEIEELDRNQIDDLRFLERAKFSPFSNYKEFVSFVPSRIKLEKAESKMSSFKNAITAHIDLLKLSNDVAHRVKADFSIGRLVTRVKLFADDLFAREAVIWRARMGLLGKRITLEDIGSELGGISRERVRQIENKLFTDFRNNNVNLIDDIEAALIKLDSDQPFYVSSLKNELPSVFVNIESDLAVLEGVLESLSEKHYVVTEYETPVISKISKTNFELQVKSAYRTIESMFRKSELPMTTKEVFQALVSEYKIHHIYARFAVERISQLGYVSEGILLSPDNNYSNIVIGLLQQADMPIHLNNLAARVSQIAGQGYVNPSSLRGTLYLAPNVRNFGRGMMGLSKHQNIDFGRVLELAQSPMKESDLLDVVNSSGSMQATKYNLMFNQDTIEVSKGMWGLALRDNPYDFNDIEKMYEIFKDKVNLSTEETINLLNSNNIVDVGFTFRDLCKIIRAALTDSCMAI